METEQTPVRELSVGQRVAHRLCNGLAADLDRGQHAEQHTASLLRMCADAIQHGYEGELVALVVAWRREREAPTSTGLGTGVWVGTWQKFNAEAGDDGEI